MACPLTALFDKPILTITDFVERTGIQRRSAEQIMEALLNRRILGIQEREAGSRPAVLAFRRLVAITQRKEFSAK